MTDFYLINFLFIFLVTLQTMAGIGVLVLGTPIMLLVGFDMINILSILLPISILTSSINFFYFKIKKKKMKIKIETDIKKYLFLVCCPSIIVGLILLKVFNDFINFNILVATVIIFSVLFTLKFKNQLIKFKKKFKIFSLGLIGLVHGITNSGGTLLSLVIIALQKNKINQTRYNTTFAYLFLALFQYISFILIFGFSNDLENLKFLPFIVLMGFILGSYFIKIVNEKIYITSIYVLALISAIFLIIRI